MTLKAGPDDIVIPYLSGGPKITLVANYEEFFNALDKTDCPVDKCVLSEISSCGTPIATGGNVEIGNANLYAIKAK